MILDFQGNQDVVIQSGLKNMKAQIKDGSRKNHLTQELIKKKEQQLLRTQITPQNWAIPLRQNKKQQKAQQKNKNRLTVKQQLDKSVLKQKKKHQLRINVREQDILALLLYQRKQYLQKLKQTQQKGLSLPAFKPKINITYCYPTLIGKDKKK